MPESTLGCVIPRAGDSWMEHGGVSIGEALGVAALGDEQAADLRNPAWWAALRGVAGRGIRLPRQPGPGARPRIRRPLPRRPQGSSLLFLRHAGQGRRCDLRAHDGGGEVVRAHASKARVEPVDRTVPQMNVSGMKHLRLS